MNAEILALSLTAAWLGFSHTLLGPDHYLPFIVIGRARKWSVLKTLTITTLCGIGHVLSSVLIGLAGVALGIAVMKLEVLEGLRGSIAGWLLIAFGFTYFVWGVHRAIRNKPHTHLHVHEDDLIHDHGHGHTGEHVHVHDQKVQSWKNLTPWVMFTILVFGPCEPLIPIIMYPASRHSVPGLLLVTTIFGLVTVLTMLTVVWASSLGVWRVKLGKLDRFSHAMAGAAVLACGLAVQFLGV